jgi:tRNA(Leu) C34 or U34 (ribose-2'-O)-methylase TrmL
MGRKFSPAPQYFPEDGTLARAHLEKYKHRIFIPAKFCMNRAATVNVILYDRMAKQDLRG